jgi:hypothetical protein
VSRRSKRKEDIRRRVSNPIDEYDYCRVFGCRRRTTASLRRGLNRLYCRRHVDQFRRHGSYFRTGYRAAVLNPYRRVAFAWLDQRRSQPAVAEALACVERLYRRGGPHVEGFRLAGKAPGERACAAWARLREAGVDPLLPLAAWVGLALCILEDPQSDRKLEFQLVQSAKIVHRMASGTHKRWEQDAPSGRPRVIEMHKYPASRGQVLRHIGRDLQAAADEIINGHLDDLRRHAGASRHASSPKRPHPTNAKTRRRRAL